MGKRIVYRAIWVPSLIAIIAMVAVFAKAPLAAPPPAELTAYSTSDKTITFKLPSNWKARSMSMNGVMTEVWIEPARHLYMNIKADLAGSLMADIAKSTGNVGENFAGLAGSVPGAGEAPKEERKKSPLEVMHEGESEVYAKAYPNYQEGITTHFKIRMMEALMTDFTYEKSSMWGRRPMMGTRITALPSDRRLSIVYQYPKELSEQVGPIFKKIVASLDIHQEGQR